jgi:hypothetical protein
VDNLHLVKLEEIPELIRWVEVPLCANVKGEGKVRKPDRARTL